MSTFDDYERRKPNSRGVWRRKTFESYLDGEPERRTLLDIDSLAAAEGMPWSIGGTFCFLPELRQHGPALARCGSRNSQALRCHSVPGTDSRTTKASTAAPPLPSG